MPSAYWLVSPLPAWSSHERKATGRSAIARPPLRTQPRPLHQSRDDASNRYAVGASVILAGYGAWFQWEQPVLAVMAVVAGSVIVKHAEHRAESAHRKEWDGVMDGAYHDAVCELRDAIAPAYARHCTIAPGVAWDQLKADVWENGARVMDFMLHITAIAERDAIFRAASKIQSAYLAFDEALRAFWDRGAFKRWAKEAWGRHDEILILWILIEKQRNSATRFDRQQRLFRYRGVGVAIRQLERGIEAGPSGPFA